MHKSFLYGVLIASIVSLINLKIKMRKTVTEFNSYVTESRFILDSMQNILDDFNTVTIPSADTVVLFDDVVDEIKKYNWKFPHIVLAQLVLESAEFNSNVARINNNLAGMKVANRRLTNAKKSKHNSYAHYNNFKESIVDRALYEATLLRDKKTEEEYYQALGRSYAEDVNYVLKLKKVVKDKELQRIFEEKK